MHLTQADAQLFNVASSESIPVKVKKQGDETVIIDGDSLTQPMMLSISDMRIQSRVGNTARSVYLSNGAKLEFRDNEFVDALQSAHKHAHLNSLIHVLESRYRYVLLAIVTVIIIMWYFSLYGIPAMAKFVAYSLPENTDEWIGKGALQAMDKLMLHESKIEVEKKQHIRQIFLDMIEHTNDEHPYQILFREGGEFGANALALPSGIVIITDELILLAENDEEIISVLAHELGHVANRHGLRTALQNSVIALLIATITGDVGSSSSFAATLPTLLIYAKYSREFETEADDYSLNYLQKNNIDPNHFVNIMQRLADSHAADGDDTNFLATHPSARERIMRAKSALH